MTDHTELVTWGSQATADRIAVRVPIPHRNISTPQILQQYIAALKNGVFFIFLFIDPPNQNLNPILAQIRRKEDQIIGIFICCNPIHRLPNGQLNIRHISEYLITYTMTSTIDCFLEFQSEKQFENGNISLGESLEELRKTIAEWYPMNLEFNACHILIIPLNATDRNLYQAQQRLQKICDNLFGGELKFRVFTLYDYIPRDESDPDSLSYIQRIQHEHKGDICQLIQRLSPIRMYLIGNESEIPNKMSSKLIASEPNIDHEHASPYDERCTFIENQLVMNEVKLNFARRFAGAWQMTRVIPKKLNHVRDDIEFQNTLQRIHGCLENREMTANEELRRRFAESHESRTTFSSGFHAIQGAIDCPEEKEDVGDLHNKILSDWQQPAPY